MNNLAKCGCDCSNCPTYHDNIKTPEERKLCSYGWEKYLNIKLSPEKLKACDGCSVAENKRKTYYLNCKIRKCAIINEIDNCAFCLGFPCEELLKAHSVQKIKNREEFVQKTGKEISGVEYAKFIEPYAGLDHLSTVRQSLTHNEFKDFKKYATKLKFVQIDELNNKTQNIQIIYSLLTKICIETDISYARLQTIEKKREQLLKIIWTLALYGTFTTDNTLEVDCETFTSQKIHGMYNVLTEYLDDLRNYDIHCEIIPLANKGWLTPMGGLRKEGWKFSLQFGESLNGTETLKTLKSIVTELNAKYGNRAFNKFNKAELLEVDI